MSHHTSPVVEEHVPGETIWVAVRARGPDWSWLVPEEAVRIGRQWIQKYDSTPAAAEWVRLHRMAGSHFITDKKRITGPSGISTSDRGGALMSLHDAECHGERRRAQCAAVSAPFSAAKSLHRATELHRLKQLPWPRNLFGEPVSIAELLAEAAHLSDPGGQDPENVCPCGCRGEHNVPRMPRMPRRSTAAASM